jgi:hypothetical protein
MMLSATNFRSVRNGANPGESTAAQDSWLPDPFVERFHQGIGEVGED